MKTKKYRWNVHKFLSNLTALAVITVTGMLLGYVFAMWAGGMS